MSVALPTFVYKTLSPEIKFFPKAKARNHPTSLPTKKFVIWESKYCNNRGGRLINMPVSVSNKASDLGISRLSPRDEGICAFEQEAFIDGSSEFQKTVAPAGVEAILNYLSKWLVSVLFAAVILLRHDSEAIWAALGSILNVGLSVILKHILNQDRPSAVKLDPGMPSSHAQSIFFSVMFCIFSMVEWLGVNGLTTFLGALVIVFGSYLSWLRVSLQFHTISQVIVGAIFGSAFSLFWFWLWDAVFFNAFVSHLWIRIFLILGTGGFCVGFLLYVIRYWVMEEIADYILRMVKQ